STAILSALADKSPVVRTAAARVLGLRKEKEALPPLMDMVKNDQPAGKSQAPTAWGQIGDPKPPTALLQAQPAPEDRFVEHAIIYALTILSDPEPLIRALDHSSSKVKRAAAIALDQMDGSPLEKQHVVPFLKSTDIALRNTGIWLASHHSDWSDVV